MEKLCLFFVLALAVNQAVGMNLRQKRQSDDNEEDLEDRYGWNRPVNRPNWNQNPGQGQFPGQGRPVRPGQNQFPGQGQQTSSTTPASSGTTTQSSAFQACIRNCPTTAEFNPVCGSNNVTYDNPSRLACAQNCGAEVTLLRSSRCPAAP